MPHKDPEKRKALHRKWIARNQGRINRRQTRYYAEHKLRFFAYRLKSAYGLSVERYSAMIGKQLNACAVCGRQMTMIKRQSDSCYIDHCHSTGKVRGLVCLRCNLLIGQAGEDTELLAKAIDYLKRFQ